MPLTLRETLSEHQKNDLKAIILNIKSKCLETQFLYKEKVGEIPFILTNLFNLETLSENDYQTVNDFLKKHLPALHNQFQLSINECYNLPEDLTLNSQKSLLFKGPKTSRVMPVSTDEPKKPNHSSLLNRDKWCKLL